MENWKESEFFFVKIGYKDWQSPYIYADFKRKYFKKLYLHPNKAGKDSEELFKEITEAAKKVQGKDSEELFKEITETAKKVHDCIKNSICPISHIFLPKVAPFLSKIGLKLG